MAKWLRAGTAATVQVGPFVDATDGFTPETGLTIAQADCKVSLEGTSFAQKNRVGGGTHDTNGMYKVLFNTTDTGACGIFILSINISGARPVRDEWQIIPAQVYDSLGLGTDLLDANAAQLGGTSQTAKDVGAAVPAAAPGENGGLPLLNAGLVVQANAAQISEDATAADNLETMLDGTGGHVLTLEQLRINSSAAGGAVDIDNSGGPAIDAATTSGDAVVISTAAGDGVAIYGSGGLGYDIHADIQGNLSGSVGSLDTQAKADVNAEVDAALDTAVPGAPTANSINERIKAIDDLTQASGGGDLAAALTRLLAATDADSVLLDATQRAAIVALILATPANKLATDGTGRVTVGSNADKTGYALTTAPPTAGEVASAVIDIDLATYEAAAKSGTKLGNMVAAARAGALGRLQLSGGTLTIYEVDGVTVIAQFTVADDYSSRTAPV